jgi:hypothetical protein
MDCKGEWSCTFLQQFDYNCSIGQPLCHNKDSKGVLFTASMGLMMVKTMAILGYRIRNSYMLQDGTLQGLCYELPKDKDSQNKLFASIPPVLDSVLAERSQRWQGP